MMMGGGHGHLNSDAAAAILFAVLLGNLAISASCKHTMHFMASVCEVSSLSCRHFTGNSCVFSWKARGSSCRGLPEEGRRLRPRLDGAKTTETGARST